MKDRTHGIFLQKASETEDTNTAQLCDFGYDSSQQSYSDAPTVGVFMYSLKMEAEPGTWCRAGVWDRVIYEGAPEAVAASAAGAGLSLFS